MHERPLDWAIVSCSNRLSRRIECLMRRKNNKFAAFFAVKRTALRDLQDLVSKNMLYIEDSEKKTNYVISGPKGLRIPRISPEKRETLDNF